jgi:hypothetical protein
MALDQGLVQTPAARSRLASGLGAGADRRSAGEARLEAHQPSPDLTVRQEYTLLPLGETTTLQRLWIVGPDLILPQPNASDEWQQQTYIFAICAGFSATPQSSSAQAFPLRPSPATARARD